MSGSITLQHSDVNSGTAVDLLGAVTVDYAWTNLTNTTPIPGKFDIAESDVGGFENPKMVIRGVIDVGDMGSNTLTPNLLKDFAQIKFAGTTGTAIKLTIKSGGDGSTDVYLTGRPDGGYTVGGSYNNYFYGVIESFSIKFDTNTTNERKWDYNITFVETETN